jgi:hypothetical protein
MTGPAPPDIRLRPAPEDSVMSIPHGPVDLLLAALLSLLLATLTIGAAVA